MRFRLSVTSIIFFMFVCIQTVHGNLAIVPAKEAVAKLTKEEKITRLEEIESRVKEIKAMDKSTLTKADRKALKKELREMRKEAKVISGGVYLSVGAIIIIILLLILIL